MAKTTAWKIVPKAGVSPTVERLVVTPDGRTCLGRIYKDRKYWVAVIDGWTAVHTSMNMAVIRARENGAEA